MKSIRRWAILGVVALLVLGLLPRSAAAQGPVTLKYYFPVAVTGPLTKLMQEIVSDFNASHPGIRVEPVFAGNYIETMAKAMTALLGGTPPDVAVLENHELFSLLERSAIIPLDDFVAKEGGKRWLDEFYGPALHTRVSGHIYSIPWQLSTAILFYNADLFRKAGLDPGRPPKNWTELVEYAQKLTARDAGGNVIQWGVEAPVVGTFPWLFQAFLIQAGANYFDAQNGKWVNLSSPEAVSALQFILDLQDKHRVHPPGPSGPAFWRQTPQDFVRQKAAMIYTSTGNMTFVRTNAKFDWNVAFLPAGKRQGTVTGGGSFYVFKGIPPGHAAAAWEFIRWMTEPAQAARWAIGTGYLPIRRVETSTPAFAAYLKELPQAQTATLQLRVAEQEMSIRDVDQINQILFSSVQAAQSGRLTAQGALDEAQKKAEAILSK